MFEKSKHLATSDAIKQKCFTFLAQLVFWIVAIFGVLNRYFLLWGFVDPHAFELARRNYDRHADLLPSLFE